MRVLLFLTHYNKYLEQLYNKNKHLENLSYDDQLSYILSDYFDWPPALIKRLVEHGCEIKILVVNAHPLQRAWARENNCKFDRKSWLYDIPLQQVKCFKPDIIWVVSTFQFFGEYLKQLRVYSRKVFAWIAYPPPPSLDLSAVDCVLTSHANFQEYFIEKGKPCKILLPTFEPQILSSCPHVVRDIQCSFIGSLSYMHLQRMEMLKQLSDNTPLQIWSTLPKLLSKGLSQPRFIRNYLNMSSLKKRMRPSVWGIDMYRVLSKSRISINVHIDAASGLAGNIRMFDTTGMGALLITEKAPNIRQLYEPGSEIITYENSEDLINLVNYYIDHPIESQAIAQSGQERTLRNHSTIERSKELVEIFKL